MISLELTWWRATHPRVSHVSRSFILWPGTVQASVDRLHYTDKSLDLWERWWATSSLRWSGSAKP
jgi:hypothetical protein